MPKRELTKDEKDLVYWYDAVINANQHNARLMGKFLSDRQAEQRYLDVAGPDDSEKFLAAKKLAKKLAKK